MVAARAANGGGRARGEQAGHAGKAAGIGRFLMKKVFIAGAIGLVVSLTLLGSAGLALMTRLALRAAKSGPPGGAEEGGERSACGSTCRLFGSAVHVADAAVRRFLRARL